MVKRKVKQRKLEVGHGWGGPPHDPYTFMERTVHHTIDYGYFVNCMTVTLHEGLMEHVTINGEKFEFEEDDARETFEDLTGIPVATFDTAYNRIASTCCRCGHKGMPTFARGLPGEMFMICGKCDHIINTYMDYSAII